MPAVLTFRATTPPAAIPVPVGFAPSGALVGGAPARLVIAGVEDESGADLVYRSYCVENPKAYADITVFLREVSA